MRRWRLFKSTCHSHNKSAKTVVRRIAKKQTSRKGILTRGCNSIQPQQRASDVPEHLFSQKKKTVVREAECRATLTMQRNEESHWQSCETTSLSRHVRDSLVCTYLAHAINILEHCLDWQWERIPLLCLYYIIIITFLGKRLDVASCICYSLPQHAVPLGLSIKRGVDFLFRSIFSSFKTFETSVFKFKVNFRLFGATNIFPDFFNLYTRNKRFRKLWNWEGPALEFEDFLRASNPNFKL